MSNKPNTRPQKATSNRVNEARGAGGGGNGLLIGGGVAIVIVLALLVAVFVGRSSDTAVEANDAILTAEPVSVTGDALPTFDDTTRPDPAVGLTMPILSGDDLTGQPLTIGPNGKAQMLVYLAHWCPHCQREVPQLVTWLKAGGNGDVDVRGVTTGIDPKKPNYPPTKWLASEGWTVPTLIDPSGLAAQASGLSGYPYFIFLDASGKVTARTSGELSIEQIESYLTAARAGSGATTGTTAVAGPSSPAEG